MKKIAKRTAGMVVGAIAIGAFCVLMVTVALYATAWLLAIR